MTCHGLCAPDGTRYSRTQFTHELMQLNRHFVDQMDLCGGWSSELADAMTPRCTGVFYFAQSETMQLKSIARYLGSIYKKLGKAIESDLNFRKRALSMIPAGEAKNIGPVLSRSPWATTLRADVIFDRSGQARIVEVNSDNVGGIEAIDLMLRFYIESYRLRPESSCAIALRAMNSSLRQLVLEEWNHFPGRSRPQPTIAVAFQDRDVSSFAARYLAAMLSRNGFHAFARRPEHFQWGSGKGVVVKNPVCGTTAVDVLWKHWLSCEMYESGAKKGRQFNPVFLRLFNASARQELLVLSAFADRLLFSKEWMVELCEMERDQDQNRFPQILSAAERRFIAQYFVPSRRCAEVKVGSVIKAADSFGGKQVEFVRKDRPVWIEQPEVVPHKVPSLFRMNVSGPVETKELYAVHGVVVHTSPSGQGRLAGVMTRVGPEPIVNWASGAQFVPGICGSP